MLKKILTILLILTSSVCAEVIKELRVDGNERISIETIKVYGDIEIGKDYSKIDLNNVLKNLYSTNFFENVQVNLSNGILRVTVNEYPVVSTITLKGEESNNIKQSILKILKLKPQESYIESFLDDDLTSIKKAYASLGYNFLIAEPKIEKFSGNRVGITIDLNKGNKTFIKKINFIGDKKIKDARLRSIIVSEENKFWKFLTKNVFFSQSNIELDKRLLVNYFKSRGYYDVQVLSENAEIDKDNNSTTITYTINAGNKYKIKKISTNIDEVIDKNLFNPLKSSYVDLVGEYYSPFKVKKLLDEVDILIANNDLQFIEHSINEIIENDSIEIKINIFEGKKEIVEKINIFGNTVTDEAVIRAELLVDEGDPFNKLKLDQSINKLKSRNLFGNIDVQTDNGSEKDQKIINVSVEEKPTGEISAGAGIGTNGATLAFNVSENNWLGKGVNISTDFELSSETFSGGLSVTDPNYKASGNSLSYYVENTRNDKPNSGFKNNILSFGAGTKFEQYKDVYLSPNLKFSYDDLKVEDSASAALKKQKGAFSDLSFDYNISSDKRDRVYGPTDGHIINFGQAIPLYADSPYIRNSFSFNKYKAFTENIIGAFKFYSSAINGINNKDVRISKRIGANSSRLRGFENGKVGPKDGADFIGGNYVYLANFEFNLPNLLPESTKTDVGTFIDIGNVWGVDYDDTIDSSNKIRSSVGVTTSWLSPVGPMSFVFSQNISKASTDITESFNFRLGTTF